MDKSMKQNLAVWLSNNLELTPDEILATLDEIDQLENERIAEQFRVYDDILDTEDDKKEKGDDTRECLVCWGNGYIPSDEEGKEMEECSLCDGTGQVLKTDIEEAYSDVEEGNEDG